MKTEIILWTAIVSTVISETSTTLKGDINALCTRPVSYRRSRVRTSLEKYTEAKGSLFNTTKVRTKFETTYYTAWTEKQICCLGYEEKYGTCEPQCSPPCKNGYCAQPNVCLLSSTYILTSVASPRLTRSVANLNDAGNGTTKNFTVAVSQRSPCQDGYQNGTNRECVPICKKPCNNGTCTAPDNCTCSSGFRKNSMTMDCDPVCTKPCINGICKDPETCACLDGYAKSSLNSSTCEPKCENCANGFCKAPNECVCNEGFTKVKKDNKTTCVGFCKPECINGVCYSSRENDTCEKPYLCFVSNLTQNVLAETESKLQELNVSDPVTKKPQTKSQLPACRPECLDQLGNMTEHSTQNTTNGTYHFIPIDSSCNMAAYDLASSIKYRTVIGAVLGIVVFGMVIGIAYYMTRKLTRRKDLTRHESLQCLYTDYVGVNSNEEERLL